MDVHFEFLQLLLLKLAPKCHKPRSIILILSTPLLYFHFQSILKVLSNATLVEITALGFAFIVRSTNPMYMTCVPIVASTNQYVQPPRSNNIMNGASHERSSGWSCPTSMSDSAGKHIGWFLFHLIDSV
ncbi:conserved hypothetical protein [Ricinus communis]|uniref:Uncharacterized protein n=1 Tax=Ricinus communis TaxID=3988 RepID=B9SXK2_RICCO|nr:conserved hypothetical protein [Ricinus communis]